MECLKLPMLKFGQIFVPHKIFEIIFSYESYIQTKTYQSFEYAQSTKYYICCIFPQSYHIIQEMKPHVSCNFESNWWKTPIWDLWTKPVTLIYHYPKSWLYQIYIFNTVIKDKNTGWSLISVITIFPWGDKKTIAIF